MLNRLNRLRFNTVVRGDHEDDDVRCLRSARSHRGKCRMAWRVEEGDAALFGVDMISADMLRDTTCLTGRDLGASNIVEQRGLAVIDMPHNRNNRGTCNLITRQLFIFEQGIVDLAVADGSCSVAQLFHHQDRRILIDDLVDRNHGAHIE